MARILVVGDLSKVDGLMRGLAEEKGMIVDHAVDENMAYVAMRSEQYDLVVLEPGLRSDEARYMARVIKASSSNRVCVIAPLIGLSGYGAGKEFGIEEIDFIAEACPRRIMEAYEKFENGSDDL